MAGREIHTRAVLLAAACIAGAVLLAVASVFGLLRHWDLPADADPLQPRPPAPPQPALQSAPQPDLVAYRAEKQRQLDGLGWVDQARGIAHIPIADAMELMVQRGRRR